MHINIVTTRNFFKVTMTMVAIVAMSFGAKTANAQNSKVEVTGMIVDSSSVPLAGATVVLMQQSDSVMTSFGVSNKQGAFKLRRVPAGAYILQVTFVGFGPDTQQLDVAGSPIDVGTIALGEDVSELNELVISEDRIPMLIKGDTLEYNADAFYTRANANVQELLKRLPGVEVERDGTIKAQGETVQKILVDGKEFFGDDPKIATQNLPADAIKKVQVYDKQSDIAEFTGIDDGDEAKTINLELKEDSKKGYFGDVTAGFGDNTRYDGKLNLNRFSPSTQFSVIGNVNNINRQSFSFGDFMSFMGGMSSMMSGGGFSFDTGGVQLGGDISDGFSTTTSGGLNFSRDFGSKTELTSSYFLNHIDNNQERDVLQQQLIGSTGSSLVSQASDQGSKNLNHRLNLNVKHEFSKGHDIRLRSNASASDASLTNRSLRQSFGVDDVLQNLSNSDYTSDGKTFGGSGTLTYRKKLSESGRSLIGDARLDVNDSDQDGTLLSTTDFYQSGNVLTSDEIAQIQSQFGNTITNSQKLSFIEPIGIKYSVEVHADRRSVQEDQDKAVFDSDLGDGSRTLNEDLSTAFQRTYTYGRGGFNVRRNVEGFSIAAGLDVQSSRLDGEILDLNTAITNKYRYLLPSASISYQIRQGLNLDARYSSSTREPSMRDLQPIVDNSNPLNIYQGNPNLKPQYTHRANVHFMYFDQFSFTNLFAFVSASYTKDAIVRSRTIDDQLSQTSTVVNSDGGWNVSGNVSFGRPIAAIGTKFNLSNNVMFNRGIEFINSEENRTNTIRNTVDLKLENRNKKYFDVSGGAKYTLNVNKYSLNPNLNQNYVNRSFYAELTYTPTPLWAFTTGMDYRLFSQDVFGSSESVPLLRAEISRTLLQERGQLQLVALDLLNKNLGVNFTNTGSYIQEERINSLGRYVMLKFIYNLRGTGRSGGGVNVDIRG